MEGEIFENMGKANQEVRDWWFKKRNRIEKILSTLDNIVADLESDGKDLIVRWVNTYIDFLIELSDPPIYDYIPLFCKTFLEVTGDCKSCPFGVSKGICHAESSLMDMAAEQIERIKTTLELMKMTDLPDEDLL